MIGIVDNRLEEKRKMYNKLSKKEIIDMLIESNKLVNDLTALLKPTFNVYNDNRPQKVPYHEVCGCDVCHCIMGNKMVDLDNTGHYTPKTNFTTN